MIFEECGLPFFKPFPRNIADNAQVRFSVEELCVFEGAELIKGKDHFHRISFFQVSSTSGIKSETVVVVLPRFVLEVVSSNGVLSSTPEMEIFLEPGNFPSTNSFTFTFANPKSK